MALALLERQVATAMALEDGATVRFDDGTIACVAHRAVRDGARVALLTVPGLLRLDVRCTGDTLGFAVRHLSCDALESPARQSEPQPIKATDGTLRHEYRFDFALQDGPRVEIVVWLAQYRGELVREHSAVALIEERVRCAA